MLFRPEELKNYEICYRDSKYSLYHDESIKDGYWHGMLLIPNNKRNGFFTIIKSIRNRHGYLEKISFKDINGPGQKFNLAEHLLQVCLGFLRSKPNKEILPVLNWDDESGNNDGSPYHCLDPELMGAKFILFRVKDDHRNMTYFRDKVCKVETTLRMGITGGLHFLGSSDKKIHIEKIHLDGYQQNNRHADVSRIVDRIYGLRDYCSFGPRESLIDDRSSNPKSDDHQALIDCEFLMLTDLLIGSFRVALSGFEKNNYKKRLSLHAEMILERMSQGRHRMGNSRWANSFWLSECELTDGQWAFHNIELIKPDNRNQLPLDFII